MLFFKPTDFLDYYSVVGTDNRGQPTGIDDELAGVDKNGHFFREGEASRLHPCRDSTRVHNLPSLLSSYIERQVELAAYPEFQHVSPITKRSVSKWPLSIATCRQISRELDKESMTQIHSSEVDLLRVTADKYDPKFIEMAIENLVRAIRNCLERKPEVGAAWTASATKYLRRLPEDVRRQCREARQKDDLSDLTLQLETLDYLLEHNIDCLQRGFAPGEYARTTFAPKKAGSHAARAGAFMEQMLDAMENNEEKRFFQLMFRVLREVDKSLKAGEKDFVEGDDIAKFYEEVLQTWDAPQQSKNQIKELFRSGEGGVKVAVNIMSTQDHNDEGEQNVPPYSTFDFQDHTKELLLKLPMLMGGIMRAVSKDDKEYEELVGTFYGHKVKSPESYKETLALLWKEDQLV